MQSLIPARKLTDDEVSYLLAIEGESIVLDTLTDLFANTEKQKAKFNTYDYFFLPANKLYNSERIKTTVGRYLFNVFILTSELGPKIGYFNGVLNKDGIEDIDGAMSKMLLEDIISSDTFIEYIDKMQWLGFNLAKFLNASMGMDLLKPPESVVKRKAELIAKNKKSIDAGDVVQFNKIEGELIGLAKDELKNCPDYEIYASGARGKFNNSYKNSTIFRGGIRNLAEDGKYYISTKSLLEGIPPEESGKYADLMTQASYLRAIATREGGLTFQAHLVKINFFNCWNIFLYLKK